MEHRERAWGNAYSRNGSATTSRRRRWLRPLVPPPGAFVAGSRIKPSPTSIIGSNSVASSTSAPKTSLVCLIGEGERTTDVPLWTVPFSRNPFFLGREEELHHLRQVLTAEQSPSSSRVCALCGMAGMGKTQMAIEYVYRFRHAYQA